MKSIFYHTSSFKKYSTNSLLLLCMIAGFPFFLKGQDNQFRLYYFNEYQTTERWKIISAIGYHTSSTKIDWNRLELRSGAYFRAKRDILFFAAVRTQFTFIENSSNQIEIRPFQGVDITWPRINYINIHNRFLLEERFIWNTDGSDDDIHGRFRYRIDSKIPINRPAIVNNTIYLRPMIETYVSFGTGNKSYISSMKYTVAPGYRISPKSTLEFRYEYVTARSSLDAAEQNKTHIFRLQFVHSIERKKSKSITP